MTQGFKRGDRVEWNFRGVKVVGTVRRRLTSRTVINDRVVAASRDDPRYLLQKREERQRDHAQGGGPSAAQVN